MTMKLEGKKVLVVGLARSGLAAANFLIGEGARVTVTDLKPRRELAHQVQRLREPVTLHLGEHREKDFLETELIVLSPGVPTSHPFLKKAMTQGIPVWSEVELARRFLSGRFIGITGSNGKTTTTTLLGELFRNARRPCVVAGNIGSPLSQFIGTASSGTTFVVELSSFQLETVHQYRSHIAVLLNITPDHQDRYAYFGDYILAKERVFLNQTGEDFAVINADDPTVLALASKRVAQVFPFSLRGPLKEGIFVQDGVIRLLWKRMEYSLMRTEEVRLKGAHNLENVMAAAAAGFLSDLSLSTMADTFRTFSGVEHRLEHVRQVDGIDFYNDSKATNVEAACKALQSFDQPLIVIMGGRDKGGDFGALKPLVSERVRLLIVIGEASSKILAALGESTATLQARDLEEAVRLAFSKAHPGEVVLLAPACASFDMFRDYEHRGEVFKQVVASLKSAPSGRRKRSPSS